MQDPWQVIVSRWSPPSAAPLDAVPEPDAEPVGPPRQLFVEAFLAEALRDEEEVVHKDFRASAVPEEVAVVNFRASAVLEEKVAVEDFRASAVQEEVAVVDFRASAVLEEEVAAQDV